MAIKIITKENGEVITKTSEQVKRERKLRKYQKVTSIAALTAVIFLISSITVFADGENTTPAGVTTTTMSTLISIIMWVVRIAILAVGAIPGIIKTVQGQADEDHRSRNAGIVSTIIAGAGFAATFGIEALIK